MIQIQKSDFISGSHLFCRKVGMDPKDIPKPQMIMSPTELRLSVSYRIIENHRGTLTSVSQKGVGARFEILLPLG